MSGSALDGVAALIDASLLRSVDVGGESRLAMLETIREFGLIQLEESGDAAAVRRRHTDWCLALSERDPPWVWSVERLAELDRESANLYAAVHWATREGHGQLGLRLAAGLWPLWLVRGRYQEGRACLARRSALRLAH
jgi:predicted ATPase